MLSIESRCGFGAFAVGSFSLHGFISFPGAGFGEAGTYKVVTTRNGSVMGGVGEGRNLLTEVYRGLVTQRPARH